MKPKVRFINPTALAKPPGYTHVVEVTSGRTIYIAGQIALDSSGNIVGHDDFRAQTEQVFANLKTALESVGGSFPDVIKQSLSTSTRELNIGNWKQAEAELYIAVESKHPADLETANFQFNRFPEENPAAEQFIPARSSPASLSGSSCAAFAVWSLRRWRGSAESGGCAHKLVLTRPA